MVRFSVRLAASKQLSPLRQGDLSRLCGLYSILNALQLALFPRILSKRDLQSLYLHGIRHLARRRKLRHVIGIGMPDEVWLDLATEVAVRANSQFASEFVIMPVLHGPARRSTTKAIEAIWAALDRGQPVLARFAGPLNHFTVLSGCTPERLVFFDSSGLRWVNLRNVTLSDRSARCHLLDAATVVTLVEDW